MSLQTIELISFNICPFVQRSVITLLKKQIDFKITYIDLADKPDWFLKISPLGKVPVVRYGDEILFESAVINEFLDEISPDPLMPVEPVNKAKDRGWIEYASQLLMSQHMMSIADNKSDFEDRSVALTDKLQVLENKVAGDGYFNGASMSLVDTALAPLFTRLDVYTKQFGNNYLSEFPKLSALSELLLNLEFVQKSVISEFDEVYMNYLNDKNSYLADA